MDRMAVGVESDFPQSISKEDFEQSRCKAAGDLVFSNQTCEGI
jgi:hypothetical protein